MTKRFLLAVMAVFCLAVFVAAQDGTTTLRANLKGLNEMDNPGPGPINTPALGSFVATVSADGTTINYTLTFNNLTTPPLFSHIHFAGSGVSGNPVVFLCGPAAGSPGGPAAGFPDPPSCGAATSNTITGTLTAANIVGSAKQGVAANDMATVLRLIRASQGYVNLHSTNFPTGEIRGQVSTRPRDDE